jgi:hypothetical protein
LKKLAAVLLACALAAVAAGCAGRGAPRAGERIELYFFHETACASCNGTAELYDVFSEQVSDLREEYPYVIFERNTFTSDGREAMKELFEERGLSASGVAYPAVLIGGECMAGMDAIKERIRGAFLAAGEALA